MRSVASAVVVALAVVAAAAQQHDPAMHAQHAQEMDARGEKAMGFSQTATTHHFILLPDGGYVQVTANDDTDSRDVEAIRAHLAHIQKSFAAGDFSAPEFTHAQVPPGTEIMRNGKDEIRYSVETIKGGGRLRIASHNSQVVEAIHAFLRFQIEEHHTGDPTSVSREQRETPAATTSPEADSSERMPGTSQNEGTGSGGAVRT